jgi:hypothetical protein
LGFFNRFRRVKFFGVSTEHRIHIFHVISLPITFGTSKRPNTGGMLRVCTPRNGEVRPLTPGGG